MNRYLLGLAVAVSMPCLAQAQAQGQGQGQGQSQTPPPVSAFARLPAVSDAALSPNGQGIAILGGGPVERNIAFHVIDQPGVKGTKLGDIETLAISWAGDDFVIAQIGVYEKDGPRADYRLRRNAAIGRDGKFNSFLLQSDQLSSQLITQSMLGVVKGPPPRVVVAGLSDAAEASHDMNTRMARKGEGDTRVIAIYAVDPVTGKGTLIERGDFDTQGYGVDLSGGARVAYKFDRIKNKSLIMARAKGETRWKLIQDGADGRNFEGYSDVDDALYFTQRTDAGLQLHRLRLATNAVEPVGKPLATGDMSLIWDEHTGGVVGIQALGDTMTVEWLDPAIGVPAGTLARAFKGKAVTLRSWSQDRTRFLATAESADAPTVWYLYDRTRKEISPIGEAYPELAEAKLGTTSFFRYKARDGLEIPAYLTLPPGASPTAKAPLVVLPHGGPWARDDESFDFIVQFLASRGYAVLRPQFRGSTGFGQAFEEAGNGEYGGKMQTDIADGVTAMATNPAVDAGRACIVGASFGGYAALWGAVFDPKPYRCAASIAGVTDLGLMITEKGTDYGQDSGTFARAKAVFRAAAPDGLAKVSPFRNAAQAGVPILLIHGAQDTQVGPLHSRQMNEALRKAGKPVEYVEIAAENHYLTKTSSRQLVLEKLETFLGKHLGAPATP